MPNRSRTISIRARAAGISGLAALLGVCSFGTGSFALSTPRALPTPPAGLLVGPKDVAPILANDTSVNNRANSALSIPLQDQHETCLQDAVDDATFRGERAAGGTTLGSSFSQVPERAMVPRERVYPAWFSVLAADRASGAPATNTLLTYEKSSAASSWKLALSSEILGPSTAGVTVPATATDSAGFVTSLPPASTDGLVVAPDKVVGTVASAFTKEAAGGKLPAGITAQFGPKGAADPHLLITSYSGVGSASLQAVAARPAGVTAPSLSPACPYPAIRLADGGALVTFALYYKLAVHVQAGSVLVQPSDRSALGVLLAPGSYTSIAMVTVVMGLAVVPRAGSNAPIDVIGQASGVLSESGTEGSGSASAGGTGGPANPGAIAKKVDGAIVDIDATLGNEHAEVAGTGMVLSANGEVLTNNHVIENATAITATDIGDGKSYAATVVGYDRSSDVAVIQLSGAKNLTKIQTADSTKVRVGEAVVGIGNAGGLGGTPSYAAGKVLALDQSITASSEADGTSEQLTGLFETNAQIQPGDSGGPLVNSSGQVIGMDAAASAGLSFQQGGASATQGFSIPISAALNIAQAVTTGHSSASVHIGPTAFLGVGVAPQRTSGGFGGLGSGSIGGTASGAQVDSVVSGSPAALGHIVPGDTIVSVGGHTVASPSSLSTIMTNEKPGATVRVVYINASGNQENVTLRLAQGPPQ
jgi:S1-C subfamily serine protease